MPIPTELVGSLPRPPELVSGLADFGQGRITLEELQKLQDQACKDSIDRLVAAGETVVSDGEQRSPSFATYPLEDVLGGTGPGKNFSPNGVTIPFADGHVRQLPILTSGPFRYKTYVSDLFQRSSKGVSTPMKTAVISPSMLSLLYPPDGISGYSREQFLSDVCDECEKDIRQAFKVGATRVSMDCTELRLSLKLDPSGGVLRDFIALIVRVIDRFTAEERKNIGIHACPGCDHDSTHSLDVDYAELLPSLFTINAGYFLIQMVSEPDRNRAYQVVANHLPQDANGVKPVGINTMVDLKNRLLKSKNQYSQVVFVGLTDPTDPKVENAEAVRDRVLEAARYIPLDQLGATDDCGFSPFADDTSTSRETAFAKIASRVQGVALASETLGI